MKMVFVLAEDFVKVAEYHYILKNIHSHSPEKKLTNTLLLLLTVSKKEKRHEQDAKRRTNDQIINHDNL